MGWKPYCSQQCLAGGIRLDALVPCVDAHPLLQVQFREPSLCLLPWLRAGEFVDVQIGDGPDAGSFALVPGTDFWVFAEDATFRRRIRVPVSVRADAAIPARRRTEDADYAFDEQRIQIWPSPLFLDLFWRPGQPAPCHPVKGVPR